MLIILKNNTSNPPSLTATFPSFTINIEECYNSFQEDLPSLTASGDIGIYSLSGELQADIPGFCWMTGETSFSSTLEQIQSTLPLLSFTSYAAPSLDATLTQLNITGIGSSEYIELFDGKLPSLSFNAYAGGQAHVEMPFFTLESSSIQSVLGTMEMTLQSFYLSGLASRASEGTINIDLSDFLLSIESTVGIVGGLSGFFIPMTMTGYALSGLTGGISEILPVWSFSGEASSSGPGNIAIELPVLYMAVFSGTLETKILRYVKGKVR